MHSAMSGSHSQAGSGSFSTMSNTPATFCSMAETVALAGSNFLSYLGPALGPRG